MNKVKIPGRGRLFLAYEWSKPMGNTLPNTIVNLRVNHQFKFDTHLNFLNLPIDRAKSDTLSVHPVIKNQTTLKPPKYYLM